MKPLTKNERGCLVEITWMDPTGSIGGDLNDLDLAECVSTGRLVKINKKRLILQSSIYTGTKTGDFTCIAVSLVRSWKLISRV